MKAFNRVFKFLKLTANLSIHSLFEHFKVLVVLLFYLDDT